MKVTVCQLPDDPQDFAHDWSQLIAHVGTESSQLVLLPEMPFCPWFAATRPYQAAVWDEAVKAHERWVGRLQELEAATVVGSRPVNREGRRNNEGFVWTQAGGYRAAHLKYYLPDEVGYWEASWYERGDGRFEPIQCDGVGIGLVICTDLWFLERARLYGKSGIHILAHPRATELACNDRWLVGGRGAAIVSGAYCLSSNRVSPESERQPFGGQGWIVDPDGEVLGVTNRERPFVTVDIELRVAERAKGTYPRYAIG